MQALMTWSVVCCPGALWKSQLYVLSRCSLYKGMTLVHVLLHRPSCYPFSFLPVGMLLPPPCTCVRFSLVKGRMHGPGLTPYTIASRIGYSVSRLVGMHEHRL